MTSLEYRGFPGSVIHQDRFSAGELGSIFGIFEPELTFFEVAFVDPFLVFGEPFHDVRIIPLRFTRGKLRCYIRTGIP
ncbi:hypothetical protein D3C74_461850 [compost metagenome]